MSIFADKNLFIVTSALKPDMGGISDEIRFEQTIKTLASVRSKVPDALILFPDISLRPVSQEEKIEIMKYGCMYFDMSEFEDMIYFSKVQVKSIAETVMLIKCLQLLKTNPQMQKIMHSVKRIFKFSSRSVLEDGFDINEHDNNFGKFVFKKRFPTWMGYPGKPPVSYGADHLLITRLFSFCPSLIETYFNVLNDNLKILDRLDTEHAHFVNIPKDRLVELDKLHCYGWLGQLDRSNSIEHY